MNTLFVALIILWGQLCPNGVCPTATGEEATGTPTKVSTATVVPTTPVPSEVPTITPTPTLPFYQPTPTAPEVGPTERPQKGGKQEKRSLPSMGYGPALTAVPVGTEPPPVVYGSAVVGSTFAVFIVLLGAILVMLALTRRR